MKRSAVKGSCAVLLSLLLAVLSSCGQGTPSSSAAPAAPDKPSSSEAAPSAPAASAETAEDVITLKVGTNTAPSHPENQYARKLAELVSAKTGGKVVIEVKDSATLGDHLERLEGLRMGSIDMTLTSIGYLGGYDPVFNIFEMPYLFRDEKHQYAVFHGEVGQMVADACPQYGFILIGATEMGARHITNSKRPILTPDDLKGLKIRVPETKSSIDALTAMGGTPTPMAFSELYMGLQQKQVDGQENPFSNIYASKFYEVQDYLSLTGHQRIEQVLLFSKTNWDKLPKEYQDAIRECEPEANAFVQQVIADEEKELIGKLEEEGMKVNEVDQQAFIDKIKPLREQYVKEFGETAQTYFDMIDAVTD